ncbi:hypothetical protein [Rhodococcus sp. NPDC127528]|uniref:hypothetical protein n=1 Tax=unclassified Rhodococcus (in: high G+C Gram-positive bacteria) TaxID=192944 RepID=UPI00362A23C7
MAPLIETSPSHCPRGHRLGPRRVLVGWQACACSPRLGHRTHECRTCGAVIYTPPCTGLQSQRERWC